MAVTRYGTKRYGIGPFVQTDEFENQTVTEGNWVVQEDSVLESWTVQTDAVSESWLNLTSES